MQNCNYFFSSYPVASFSLRYWAGGVLSLKQWTSASVRCLRACVRSCFSHVGLSVTACTTALQAPLSIGLSQHEYWNGLPFMFEMSVQFSSVAQSCLTPCNPMDYSRPGLPVHLQLPEFTQTHVHWVSDDIQPSNPLLFPSPPAFDLSQHQSLFKWVSSLHQVGKVSEFQLQHQSFQWTPRTDLL